MTRETFWDFNQPWCNPKNWNEVSVLEDQILGRSGRPNENIALLRVAHHPCAPLRSLSGVIHITFKYYRSIGLCSIALSLWFGCYNDFAQYTFIRTPCVTKKVLICPLYTLFITSLIDVMYKLSTSIDITGEINSLCYPF